jgi:hypothetical protein
MKITSRVRTATRLSALLLALMGGFGIPATSEAQSPVPSEERTPPRLSFVDGQVSFWRPGAEGWTAAQVNTPLAPGDELFADSPGTLEVQIGGQAYARAWAHTQLAIQRLDVNAIRLKVTAGHAALDLRRLEAGQTVELATPKAVFTIDTAGYYRVDVASAATTFTARRGGHATLAPVGGAPGAIAQGAPAKIAENEEVVVDGATSPAVARRGAPEVDAWDQWNAARTDALLATVSSQYVSSDIYGASDLDHYGTWRSDESYGPVWTPDRVADDWVPYGDGRWIWDPLYGWTWVENAPWGWAPLHYGRWVYVSGSWAWAPGPRVARPVYAPALVAFFGGGPGVALGVARPTVGWVALGWGEPLIPWWGRPGFIGVPCWAGWGGPRVVNNVVVSHTTVVTATSVKVFRNTSVKNAVVAVPRDRFGRTSVARTRPGHVDVDSLTPTRGTIGVIPDRPNLTSSPRRGGQPPAAVRRPGGMTRDPDGPARRATTQSAPPMTAPPTPAPTAPAPASRPAPAPGPRWRREGALRDQPASPAVPGRVEPGNARLRTPHSAPATRVSPSFTGRRQEPSLSPVRQGATPAPRPGSPPR